MVAYVCTCKAQCAIPGYSEEICLFDPNTEIDAGETDSCEDANSNVFTVPVPGIPNEESNCENLIRQDGEECIAIYSKYTCSNLCGQCFKKVCKQVCHNVLDLCPMAKNANCFSSISFKCKGDNNDCVDLGVDESQLADPIDGGDGDGSGDGSGDSSSASRNVVPFSNLLGFL